MILNLKQFYLFLPFIMFHLYIKATSFYFCRTKIVDSAVSHFVCSHDIRIARFSSNSHHFLDKVFKLNLDFSSYLNNPKNVGCQWVYIKIKLKADESFEQLKLRLAAKGKWCNQVQRLDFKKPI